MVIDRPVTQTEFAAAVGISQQAVSELVRTGVLPSGASGAQWLLAYCERLREQAAGRLGGQLGGLDLVQERAALAREQRMGLEIKNAALRGEYAPIAWLSSVLATASQAVAERFDQLPGMLKRTAPDLPESARDALMTALAGMRNEWVRATSDLAAAKIAEDDTDGADDDGPEDSDEPAAH